MLQEELAKAGVHYHTAHVPCLTNLRSEVDTLLVLARPVRRQIISRNEDIAWLLKEPDETMTTAVPVPHLLGEKGSGVGSGDVPRREWVVFPGEDRRTREDFVTHYY